MWELICMYRPTARTLVFQAIIAAALCIGVVSGAEAVDTDRLKLSLSITNESGKSGSSSNYSWAGDGMWSLRDDYRRLSLQTQSRYSRSDDDRKYDQLKTWWRYTWHNVPATKWHPVVLVSTDGDHGFDRLLTLGAFGYRKNYGPGDIEFTLGASKDIRTADTWTGDVGFFFDYAAKTGKLSVGVHPHGDYGVLGEMRFRDNRFRYTIDSDLNYDIGDRLRASYRLSWSNTTKDSNRLHFLGITYEQ